MNYLELNKEKIEQLLDEVNMQCNDVKAQNYKVDISRGKPCNEQLDIAMGMLSDPALLQNMPKNYRNYGMLDGIPEMKQIFADVLGVKPSNIIVGGNSSLNMMYDAIQRALQFGVCGSTPWNQMKSKFICLVPGYDRHFAICEHFGIEMISVPLNEDGPAMDIVERLVENDDTIKGIWCVPKYSNPTGCTYSQEAVERLAKMHTKAKDFRIFWDNAYAVHDLMDQTDKLANIMQIAEKYGNEDRIYEFTSTSKITFAGAGVACMACSENNVKDVISHMSFQTIGYNKIGQYIHSQYLKNVDNINEIMKKQKAIIKPKFDKILSALDETFAQDCNIARWTKPNGGYFITLYVLNGCAKRVYEVCKDLGLTLTKAGAPFPYGVDDDDSVLRIAPTFTSNEDLEIACKILVLAVQKACLEKLLER